MAAILKPGREQGNYVLFCRAKHPEIEQKHGARGGLESASNTYSVGDAFPYSDLDYILPGLMEGSATHNATQQSYSKPRLYIFVGTEPAQCSLRR